MWLQRNKVFILCLLFSVIIAEIVTLSAVITFRNREPDYTYEDYIDLGNKYLLDMEYEQAVIMYKNAIEIEPMSIPARIGLSRAYVGLEQFDEAENTLFDIFEIERKNQDAYDELISLAGLYIHDGKYDDAKALYDLMIDEFEKDPGIYTALQELYDMMERYDLLADVIKEMREYGLEEYIIFGEVIGRVIDAVYFIDYFDIYPLPDTLICVQGSGYERNSATDNEGMYQIFLREGNYEQTAEAGGFIPFKQVITVVANEITYLANIEMVPVSDGIGTLIGQVIDSISGYGVPYAVIEVFNQDLEKIDEVYSDSAGFYNYTNIAGYYLLQADAAGYLQTQRQLALIGYRDITNRDITISPVLEEGEIRIVLTWGEHPYDLDSHLCGPVSTGEMFHIWYSNMYWYENDTRMAFLDLDDTESYGPETTTIYYIVEDGIYSFIVHDYTNRYIEHSTALADSGANVKVYIGNLTMHEFNVPPGLVGNIWHVFDMVNGEILPPVSKDWEYVFQYEYEGWE